MNNINKRKIEVYNIFNHGGFREDIIRATKEYENKEEFLKYLQSSLMHYFWSKSEWEVIVTPWVGGDIDKDSEKIDVYKQVMNNWEIFSDYVWNNKKIL